jgi:hypothetical protein
MLLTLSTSSMTSLRNGKSGKGLSLLASGDTGVCHPPA